MLAWVRRSLSAAHRWVRKMRHITIDLSLEFERQIQTFDSYIMNPAGRLKMTARFTDDLGFDVLGLGGSLRLHPKEWVAVGTID